MSRRTDLRVRRLARGVVAPCMLTVLFAGARADVPAEFPARYDTHLVDRVVLTATMGGRTVTRRERTEVDRTIVFDDATNLHMEGEIPYPITATWRRQSRRSATFRLSQETIDAYRAWAGELMQVEGPMQVSAPKGRLRFSADGTEMRGTSRNVVRFRSQGMSVTLVENYSYAGTRD